MKKLLMVAGLLFAQGAMADYREPSNMLVDLSKKDDGWDQFVIDGYPLDGSYGHTLDGSFHGSFEEYENRYRSVNMYADYNGGYGSTYGGAFAAPANVYQSTNDVGQSPIPFPTSNNYPGWYHQENFAIVDNYDFYNLVPGDTYYSSDWGYFVASPSGDAVVSTQVGGFSVVEAPEIDANLAGLSIGLLSGILFLSAERRRAAKI